MLPEIIMLISADGTEREMTRESFTTILNSKLRNIVASEGSVIAKVISSNPWTDPESGEERTILGFNVIAQDQVATIKQHLADGEFSEALNVSLTSNLRPSASFIPAKGESVKLSIGMVKNREDQDVLRVTGVSPLPKAATKSLSLDDLLGAASPPSSEPDFDVTVANKDQLLAKAQELNINVAPHLTSAGAIKTTAVESVRALVAAEL